MPHLLGHKVCESLTGSEQGVKVEIQAAGLAQTRANQNWPALVLRAFRSILFEIAPADMLVFSCVCGLLIAVALVAALIPGWRAATIDPMQALRSE
jgi:ABC-type lipoprotein release transport system permease subunit